MGGMRLGGWYGRVLCAVGGGALLAGSLLVVTPSAFGSAAKPVLVAAVPPEPARRGLAPATAKSGAKGHQKQTVAWKAQRARRVGAPAHSAPSQQHEAGVPPQKECLKDPQPEIATLGAPLVRTSGAGIDVATLRAACEKKNYAADLSDRLGSAPADGTAVAERKAVDKGQGVRATIGAYQGRLSEKEFSVNIGSTFR